MVSDKKHVQLAPKPHSVHNIKCDLLVLTPPTISATKICPPPLKLSKLSSPTSASLRPLARPLISATARSMTSSGVCTAHPFVSRILADQIHSWRLACLSENSAHSTDRGLRDGHHGQGHTHSVYRQWRPCYFPPRTISREGK